MCMCVIKYQKGFNMGKYELMIYQIALKHYKSGLAWRNTLAKAINELINYYSKIKVTHINMDTAYLDSCNKLNEINRILDSYVQIKFVHEVRERTIRGGGWPTIVSMKIPANEVKQIIKEYKEILAKKKQDAQCSK